MPLTEKIKRLKICVIVPTYNNHKTLAAVLKGILRYTPQVLVINDGSADTTSEILDSFSDIEIITFASNKGKGSALQAGFERARALEYQYAITIDSDGQHFPEDLVHFVTAIEQATEPILLVGGRNMSQEGVPKKSSFGNRFSNFWFWIETDIRLQDTQSGYRAYPLHHIPQKLYSQKFEYEIEIMVRTAWRGVAVKNIPIQVLYDPNERVSHFRPIRDFLRISVLNTVLVFITFFYIKPRNFFRNFKNKSFGKFVREDLLESTTSNKTKALSIGLGVCMGIMPVWGFQTLLVISLAVLFRLNKALAFAFSNISIPPLIPLVVYASLKTGALFVPQDTYLIFNHQLSLDLIQEHLKQYLIGAVVLAIILGLLAGFVSYLLLSLKRKKSTHR